jgi:hypothetical protein
MRGKKMKVSKRAVQVVLKTFLIPWVLVLGLRYCGILTYSGVNEVVFLLIGLFAFPFLASAVLLLLKTSEHPEITTEDGYKGNPYSSGRAFSVVVFLTFIYLVAVVIDKVFLANVFSQGVTEARYAAMEEGPRNSLLGAVHYFLAGAPVLLACFLLSRRKSKFFTNAFLWGVVVICFGCFFLSGGRNNFVVGSVFVFFYFFLERASFRARGVGRDRKFSFPLGLKILSVVGVCYVLYLFVERARIRGMDLEGAVRALGENYNVGVYMPDFLSGTLLQIYYCLVFVFFYITHSLSYLSAYFDIDYSPLTLGGYSFSIIFRVVDVLFGTNFVVDSFERMLVAGVYLTLPGSIYIDFGFTGVFIAGIALAGISIWCVSRALKSNNGNGMMLASSCLTIAALSPVFSAFSVGNGFSIMILIVFVHAVGKRKVVSGEK